MATYKFIQKNVIGYCPESLLSRVVQHYFVIPVLKRSIEMPGCEWNPFSAASGQGSTIFLSNFQPCQWGTSRAGIHVCLWSQRTLVSTFCCVVLQTAASGGQLSPFPSCLITSVWSDKCFSFWVMVALALFLRKRNSRRVIVFFNPVFWLKKTSGASTKILVSRGSWIQCKCRQMEPRKWIWAEDEQSGMRSITSEESRQKIAMTMQGNKWLQWNRNLGFMETYAEFWSPVHEGCAVIPVISSSSCSVPADVIGRCFLVSSPCCGVEYHTC